MCTLTHVQRLTNDEGVVTSGVVFGRIVEIAVKEHVLKREGDGKGIVVDVGALKPVSRLGGNVYGRTTSGYEIARPVV
jgi:hypothetical protein